MNIRGSLSYALFDHSGDVGIRAEARSASAALSDLARALSHVLTDGSRVQAKESKEVVVTSGPGLKEAVVAFVNELIFFFDSEFFLVANAQLKLHAPSKHAWRVEGILHGERFDPQRHRSGRAAKAATHHAAVADVGEEGARFAVVLDL